MTDKEILEQIRVALKTLNTALDAASAADIEVSFIRSSTIGRLNENWHVGKCERRTLIS